MIIFISVLSFLLDGVLSHYIPPNTIFLPLFTIVSLVLIYPYFRSNDYRFFKYIAILGLLYDITYANTVFLHFFIFIVLGFIIVCFFYFLSDNWYINLLASIVVIILYRIIYYLFIVLFHSVSFSWASLGKAIYSSLILNIIYCIILYLVTYHYRKKHKIVTK